MNILGGLAIARNNLGYIVLRRLIRRFRSGVRTRADRREKRNDKESQQGKNPAGNAHG
jgi:hypothetical protein